MARRRWRLAGSTTTRQDRAPDEVGGVRVVLLVVALKLAAWLLSGAGVHLLAARLLRAALDAVWEEHGEAMAEALADAPIHRWFDALPDDDIHDEDIPF